MHRGVDPVLPSGQAPQHGNGLLPAVGLAEDLPVLKTVDKNIDLLLAYFAEEKADIANYNVCVGYGYDYEEAVEFRDNTSRPVATRLRKPADADGISRYPVCFALRRFIAAFCI